MKKYLIFLLAFALTIACNLGATPPTAPPATPNTILPTLAIPTATDLPAATDTAMPVPTATFTAIPTETGTPTATAVPVVESLKAKVTALLSCRYGPGAEYLYLYGLNKGANIKLIGRTDGNNWVMVEGKNKCWVNAKFLVIEGDPQTLKVIYPAEYKLPVSPYYAAPIVLSATRQDNNITVKWSEVVLRAGDEEDDSMFIYIIEVWRCEGGKIIFDPLASNYPEVTFVDEPGCDIPSHGRVFFQEKHGFAGPAEIPWPPPAGK